MDTLLLLELCYESLRLHLQFCKLCLDAWELLFQVLMLDIHNIVDDILIAEQLFKILINIAKIVIQNVCNGI